MRSDLFGGDEKKKNIHEFETKMEKEQIQEQAEPRLPQNPTGYISYHTICYPPKCVAQNNTNPKLLGWMLGSKVSIKTRPD